MSLALPTRRLWIVSLVFTLFVLFDMALFGWLIMRSLSQRELEKILLETREEAQGLAQRIAGRAQRDGEDLYTALALERETQTYIDAVLRQRDIVQMVEIRDRDGTLVFRSSREVTMPLSLGGTSPGGMTPREVPPQIEKKTLEHKSSYDVMVPIGTLGMLYVGLSPIELEQRVAVLHRDLIRQAGLIGAVTLALLLSAYLGVLWLWRRSQRLEGQAREAERMAYVGSLAAGLAHEIRNPLNSLNLNMQLLEEELHDGGPLPAGRRLLAITRGEIGRLERLVNDFLSYARPRPPELEQVRPVELFEQVLGVLGGALHTRGVEVHVEDSTGGAAVSVDPAQMNQLLLNLAQNALAATEEIDRAPRIIFRARRDGRRVVLAVEDNGEGIPADQQGKIFDLFFSTRKGGTGLGLAIVERIARAHGAELRVESARGSGTTVALALPPAPTNDGHGESRAEATARASVALSDG